jgi:hypothetical protein
MNEDRGALSVILDAVLKQQNWVPAFAGMSGR